MRDLKTLKNYLRILGVGVKGIGGLLGFAAELERQGKSEHIEHGEIKGKTRLRQGFGGQAKSGKEYRGAYGLRVKVGLNGRNPRSKAQMSNQIQNSNVKNDFLDFEL